MALEIPGNLFGIAQDSEDIQASHFLDVVFGVAAAHQFGQQGWIAGDIVQALYTAVKAFEIRAEADVIDAGDFADVVDVIGDVLHVAGSGSGCSLRQS